MSDLPEPDWGTPADWALYRSLTNPPSPAMNPEAIYLLTTPDLGLFFEGTVAQFDDCYGGTPGGTEEADIVTFAFRNSCHVYRRVDSDYVKPSTQRPT